MTAGRCSLASAKGERFTAAKPGWYNLRAFRLMLKTMFLRLFRALYWPNSMAAKCDQ